MEQAKQSSEASPSFVQAKAAAKSDATWGRRRRRTFLNRAHQFAECRGRGTYRSLEYTHVKFGQQNCLGVAVDPAKLGGKKEKALDVHKKPAARRRRSEYVATA